MPLQVRAPSYGGVCLQKEPAGPNPSRCGPPPMVEFACKRNLQAPIPPGAAPLLWSSLPAKRTCRPSGTRRKTPSAFRRRRVIVSSEIRIFEDRSKVRHNDITHATSTPWGSFHGLRPISSTVLITNFIITMIARREEPKDYCYSSSLQLLVHRSSSISAAISRVQTSVALRRPSCPCSHDTFGREFRSRFAHLVARFFVPGHPSRRFLVTHQGG